MNGTKTLKDNPQETNSSDSNNTIDTSKRYKLEYFYFVINYLY